jgi:hypothetical protein
MRRALAAAAVAALGAAGCGHNMLDRDVSEGTPTTAAIEDVPVKGFAVVVEPRRGRGDDVKGELLAADERGVWVLTDEGTRFVPREAIEEVRVNVYSNLGWVTLAWTVTGALSTASHGFFLVLTAPAWGALGGGITGAEFAKGKAHAWSNQTPYLYQFARFPAGLPAGWHDAPKPPRPEPLVPDWPGDR